MLRCVPPLPVVPLQLSKKSHSSASTLVVTLLLLILFAALDGQVPPVAVASGSDV